ncbi:MAG: TIGR03960 family B12-binding radical SAM protein [Desulfosalsimonadaceae bacterium]
MDPNIADYIRAFVAKPSRYLGSEANAVQKFRDAVKLRFALAFPDLYDIGMSHFGMQILYNILNRQSDICAERVFAPGADMAARLREEGLSLFSLESKTGLKDFDIVGFSLLYELNYTNVLAMLDLAGIPFRAFRRDAASPFIIAGGPCACNPEPVAEFFDAIVVGDGEDVIVSMARAWIRWHEAGGYDREALLRAWSDIDGVYIPSFFEPWWDAAGFERLAPKKAEYRGVTRAVVPDLDSAVFPESPVVPFGKPVHDRLRLEVARGCSRGCRFCQAGMIYRPVRERSLPNLIRLSHKALACTGYDDISLLSLSTGDYSRLLPLMQELVENRPKDPVAVSLPSFRAGTLSREMMGLVQKVRKTGFTIAPEAGSERLRRVINKNLSEEEILETAGLAFELGWQVIKLYFMIGLPTETEADIDAIVGLVEKIRRKKGKAGRKTKINVSVATFIPKPHTPFQWQPQLSVEKADRIIDYLRRRLKKPGVQLKWQKPQASLLEGLWARGDRRLAGLLEAAYHRGCWFDGWSDFFDYRAWVSACRDAGIDMDFYLHRNRDREEALPWDFVDCRIAKSFLWQEWENACREVCTPDCRTEGCSGCGACDFSSIRPQLATEKADGPGRAAVPAEPDAAGSETDVEIRLQMRYSKLGCARFFGHLELINIFVRALRRAGIRLQHSRGFHPKPKISFHDALPVGVESRCEEFYLSVAGPLNCENVLFGVNRELPEGLCVLECRPAAVGSRPARQTIQCYEVYRNDGVFDENALEAFFSSAFFPVVRRSRKGESTEIDLKGTLQNLSRRSPEQLFFCLSMGSGPSIRPGDAVQAVFALSSEEIQTLRIIKVMPDEDRCMDQNR